MKTPIIEALKTIALRAAAAMLRALPVIGRLLRAWAGPVGRVLKKIYTFGIHPLVLIAYSWYMRGALSLSSRGISVRHPIFSLMSGRRIGHTMFVLIGIAVFAHTAYLKNANAQEFFIPHNALSRLFFTDDEFSIVIEETGQATSQEYIDRVGVRAQPTLNDTTDEAEARGRPDPGSIAAIPDALIKPILPGMQQEPYAATSIQTYSVRPGDTLGAIARARGISLATLLASNNLTERSTIHEGQKLIILPVDGIQYRVRRGDTLARIALEYQSTISKIMNANNRESANDIAIGELLIIPDAVIRTPRSVPQRQTIIARIRNAIVPSSSAARAARGLFIWPTSANRISQYFSWRHTGVDIAGPTTNRIYAAGDGKVIFAGWARGYGLSVVVDHGNGVKTRYGHSRLVYVRSGDYVSQGQTIAMVGSTGRSTGPHLHFEVIKNNIRVNPFGYIR